MDNRQLAAILGQQLIAQQAVVTTAESCTGGGVAHCFTAIPGSSKWFEQGFVTYSNRAKREILGVSTNILARFGAASEKTAAAMATGALSHGPSQFALAITGIAGPGGGSAEKPIGTVCFAWAGTDREMVTTTEHFSGDRDAVRQQSITRGIQGMIDYLK